MNKLGTLLESLQATVTQEEISMLEGIYIVIAVLLFFAQLQNGFFTALLTAVFWPIVIAGSAIFIFFTMIYHVVKK